MTSPSCLNSGLSIVYVSELTAAIGTNVTGVSIEGKSVLRGLGFIYAISLNLQTGKFLGFTSELPNISLNNAGRNWSIRAFARARATRKDSASSSRCTICSCSGSGRKGILISRKSFSFNRKRLVCDVPELFADMLSQISGKEKKYFKYEGLSFFACSTK